MQVITGAVGEELGWRGFLLPRLGERMGAAAAAWVMGILWRLWHVPRGSIPRCRIQPCRWPNSLLHRRIRGVSRVRVQSRRWIRSRNDPRAPLAEHHDRIGRRSPVFVRVLGDTCRHLWRGRDYCIHSDEQSRRQSSRVCAKSLTVIFDGAPLDDKHVVEFQRHKARNSRNVTDGF